MINLGESFILSTQDKKFVMYNRKFSSKDDKFNYFDKEDNLVFMSIDDIKEYNNNEEELFYKVYLNIFHKQLIKDCQDIIRDKNLILYQNINYLSYDNQAQKVCWKDVENLEGYINNNYKEIKLDDCIKIWRQNSDEIRYNFAIKMINNIDNKLNKIDDKKLLSELVDNIKQMLSKYEDKEKEV